MNVKERILHEKIEYIRSATLQSVRIRGNLIVALTGVVLFTFGSAWTFSVLCGILLMLIGVIGALFRWWLKTTLKSQYEVRSLDDMVAVLKEELDRIQQDDSAN